MGRRGKTSGDGLSARGGLAAKESTGPRRDRSTAGAPSDCTSYHKSDAKSEVPFFQRSRQQRFAHITPSENVYLTNTRIILINPRRRRVENNESAETGESDAGESSEECSSSASSDDVKNSIGRARRANSIDATDISDEGAANINNNDNNDHSTDNEASSSDQKKTCSNVEKNNAKYTKRAREDANEGPRPATPPAMTKALPDGSMHEDAPRSRWAVPDVFIKLSSMPSRKTKKPYFVTSMAMSALKDVRTWHQLLGLDNESGTKNRLGRLASTWSTPDTQGGEAFVPCHDTSRPPPAPPDYASYFRALGQTDSIAALFVPDKGVPSFTKDLCTETGTDAFITSLVMGAATPLPLAPHLQEQIRHVVARLDRVAQWF